MGRHRPVSPTCRTVGSKSEDGFLCLFNVHEHDISVCEYCVTYRTDCMTDNIRPVFVWYACLISSHPNFDFFNCTLNLAVALALVSRKNTQVTVRLLFQCTPGTNPEETRPRFCNSCSRSSRTGVKCSKKLLALLHQATYLAAVSRCLFPYSKMSKEELHEHCYVLVYRRLPRLLG